MNIFYLDKDPVSAAQMHVDKHVIKMILESAQLLSTAHRILDGKAHGKFLVLDDETVIDGVYQHTSGVTLYRQTHLNHPSAIWCRSSDSNYMWLYQLFVALLNEYTYRYGKVHASSRLLSRLSQLPKNIKSGPFTEPTMAMPVKYQIPGDAIASYRTYYLKDKASMAKWKNRNKPIWWNILSNCEIESRLRNLGYNSSIAYYTNGGAIHGKVLIFMSRYGSWFTLEGDTIQYTMSDSRSFCISFRFFDMLYKADHEITETELMGAILIYG